jgi:ketosteroid isomerase-like protein
MSNFDAFLEIRRQAAQAYVNGQAGPLDQLTATACPASFFPPRGGREEGAEWVSNIYARDAGSFAEGGETTLEILHSDSVGDLAYWTGLQHATVRLTGHDEPVEMHLRITELFRHEDGAWRLIHRHADPLVEAKAPG